MTMHKLTFFALPLLALPAFAQENPVSTWLKTAWNNNYNNILRSAQKMPEENFNLRPGTQPEVRTFGQQIGHVANFNFLWCSQAKGEGNPNAGKNLEKLTTKAEFIKAAQDAHDYCQPVYDSLTDKSGEEIVTVTQESGRQTQNARMALLILNYGHNNEIYGSVVTSLRQKDIVPPASEPRPAQKK
jgi:uncharacterized damage-inducible protein DinB